MEESLCIYCSLQQLTLAMEREEECMKCGYNFPVHKLKQHVMGCKLVGRAKRAPHWGVQSRFRVIYVYIYVYNMSVCLVCQINCVGGIT